MPTNWTHGSAVGVEYPKNVADGGPNTPGGHPRRAGWGTDVRQKANTSNWFHFAIPSEYGTIQNVMLQCWLNEWARVDAFHVWLDGNQIYAVNNIGGLQNKHVFESRSMPQHSIGNRGINLSVHVSFLPGNAWGWVRFYGAGARIQ